EEQGQAEPPRSAPEIGAAWVDPGVHVLPGLGPERPDTTPLVGRQDREFDAGLGEDLERLAVDRGLWKPEPLGLSPEPRAEVGDPPAHLRDLVATCGER